MVNRTPRRQPLAIRTQFARLAASVAIGIPLCASPAAAEDRSKSASPALTANVSDSQASGSLAVFQFNIQRTGYLKEGKSLPTHPKVVWEYRSDSFGPGSGPATPLFADGALFFGDDAGRMHALNATNGKSKWIFESGSRIMVPPTVSADRLYFVSDNAVKCLLTKTGARKWVHELQPSAIESSPLLVKGILYVACQDGYAYGLDPNTGETRWKTSLTSDVPSEPKLFRSNNARIGRTSCRPTSSASDGETFFQSIFDQSRVVALDCRTGAKRWSFAAGGWVYGCPGVSDKSVIFGAQDGRLYCVDRMTGNLAWKFQTAGGIGCGVAIANGRVYFCSNNGRVFCVKIDTGRQIWSHLTVPEAGGLKGISCAPLVTDEMVYVAAFDGQIYGLDVASGEEVWNLRAARNSHVNSMGLATDGRRLFFATRGGFRPANQGEYAIFAIGDD